MRVGLIDVDGHNFPNIPLMKISSYYKKLGNSVEWYEPMFSGHMDAAGLDYVQTDRGGVVLNLDNADTRNAMELCYRTRKTLINPIIEWEDDDVWEFIHKYNVPYCELYDQGYKRLGCIGCPMNTEAAAAELERYPKYKHLYMKAFERMLEEIRASGGGDKTQWKTAEDVMKWWLKQE